MPGTARKRSYRFAVGLTMIAAALPVVLQSSPSQAAAPSILSDMKPTLTDNGHTWSGRMVAVDATQDLRTIVVASDNDGLWKSTDSGSTWRHLDSYPGHVMS